jgi:Homing endonuclease associated repeat
MSKQEIVEAIVGCAERLGRTPSIFEMMKMTQVTRRQMRKHFGSYSHALRECNLERESSSGQRVPLERLFTDWAGVVRKTGKAPSMSEYEALSKYSCKPLVRCFGSWRQVPYGLTQFAEGSGLAEAWRSELELAAARPGSEDAQWLLRREARADRSRTPTAGPTAGPTYGPPMWPGPLAYAPVNELGVVFLFGVMAQQLGFVVHRLQTEFPDCEAMRQVGDQRWQLVRIEFEYESRNFLKHMHEASECDLIVCWRHNWAECPLEVVELRKAVSAQHSAKTLAPQIYADER